MCEPFQSQQAISTLWHILLTHMFLWTNHLCISINHILVHLSCHSITKTKQGPFNLPLFGNWWQLYKDMEIKLLGQASTSHKCKLLTWFGFYATYPTFKLYVKIWISTIKSDLVVLTPPTCVLKWFGFKLAHMHKYEICGRVSTTKWC